MFNTAASPCLQCRIDPQLKLRLQAIATERRLAKRLEKLKAVFGDMPADKITPQHCYKYLDSPAKHPVAARHEISLLGHVFAKAIRWGAGTVNPVRTLERTAKGRRTRYLTDADYDAVRALANERMQIAMDLALLTGQRRGDLLALRRAQLTDEGIVFRQSKTAAGVLVEWTDELRRITDRAQGADNQVCLSPQDAASDTASLKNIRRGPGY
jgi:integrase